jgi:YidC/Oxa1 family membrane protein insertase
MHLEPSSWAKMPVLSKLFILRQRMPFTLSMAPGTLQKLLPTTTLSSISPWGSRLTVNSESRSLLAIASCVVLYLGYQQYLSWKYPDLNKPSQVASSSQSSSPSATKPAGETQPQAAGSAVAAGESVLQPGQQATAVATLAPENLTLETDTVTWRFSQANGSVETVTLKNYKATKDTNSGPVELFDSPLALQGKGVRSNSGETSVRFASRKNSPSPSRDTAPTSKSHLPTWAKLQSTSQAVS